MEKEGYIERLRSFLEGATTQAKIANVLLCVVALSAIPIFAIGVAAIGNAAQIFAGPYRRRYSRNQIKSAMQGLRRQKLIEYVCERDGKEIIKITKKGESKLRAFSIELMEIKKPKKWDGKWRLVMFDIPIRFKKGRNALRYHLKELGFFQFQKSAWAYPFPCEDEIIFIADFYGMGKYVEILTVDTILRDQKIKNHFHLH
jgi:DNA-binding transcriptional regulator PaaX